MRIQLSSLPVLLACALAGLTPLVASVAQEPTATPATASDNPLAWLVGDWVGEGLGGEVEETWLPLNGGSMLGVFRLVAKERMSFCELMTISIDDGEATMRLKHFGADLKGWEAKDESLVWPQSDVGPTSARFGPAYYELDDDGELHVWVELDGQEEPAEFVFHRR